MDRYSDCQSPYRLSKETKADTAFKAIHRGYRRGSRRCKADKGSAVDWASSSGCMGGDQLAGPCGHGTTGSAVEGKSMSSSRLHISNSFMVAIWLFYRYCHVDFLCCSTPSIDHQAITRTICQGDHWSGNCYWSITSSTLGSTSWLYRLGTILLLRFTPISNFRNHAIPTSTPIFICYCDHLRLFDPIPMSTRSRRSVLGSITGSEPLRYYIM